MSRLVLCVLITGWIAPAIIGCQSAQMDRPLSAAKETPKNLNVAKAEPPLKTDPEIYADFERQCSRFDQQKDSFTFIVRGSEVQPFRFAPIAPQKRVRSEKVSLHVTVGMPKPQVIAAVGYPDDYLYVVSPPGPTSKEAWFYGTETLWFDRPGDTLARIEPTTPHPLRSGPNAGHSSVENAPGIRF